MILISKLSSEFINEFETLSNKFHTFSISVQKPSSDIPFKVLSLNQVYPPIELFKKYLNGDINKKKFIHKYNKFMDENMLFEVYVYSIIKSLKGNTNFCFVCDNNEDYVVLKAFAKHIEKVTGVKYYEWEDFKKKAKKQLFELTDDKKKTKVAMDILFKGITPKKKASSYKKIIKVVVKSFSKNSLSSDCIEYFNHLDRKFAVDQIVMAALEEGIFRYKDKNTVVDIKPEKIKKKKSFINAILLACKEDKDYNKIVKKLFQMYNMKFNEKTLNKLSKTQLVTLCAKISAALTTFRNE